MSTKTNGFTMIEMVAAMAVVVVCIVSFAQIVALTTSSRQAERTRQTAVDQLQNVLERLITLPPETLASGEFDKSSAESLIQKSLPSGEIVFESRNIEDNLVVLEATVSWSAGESQPRRSIAFVRLLTLPKKGESNHEAE
jgi:prepilin-type N-terminal cleavage/methylation domain-containing protein